MYLCLEFSSQSSFDAMILHDRKHRIFDLCYCAKRLGLQPTQFTSRFVITNPFALSTEIILSAFDGKPLGLMADAWAKIEKYWKLYSITKFHTAYPSVYSVHGDNQSGLFFLDKDIGNFLNFPELLCDSESIHHSIALENTQITSRPIQPCEWNIILKSRSIAMDKTQVMLQLKNAKFLTAKSVMQHIGIYAVEGVDGAGFERFVEDTKTHIVIVEEVVKEEVEEEFIIDAPRKPPTCAWWQREVELANCSVTCSGLFQYKNSKGGLEITSKENLAKRIESFHVIMAKNARCLSMEEYSGIMKNGFPPSMATKKTNEYIQQYRLPQYRPPPMTWSTQHIFNPNNLHSMPVNDGSDLSSVADEDETHSDSDHEIGKVNLIFQQGLANRSYRGRVVY